MNTQAVLVDHTVDLEARKSTMKMVLSGFTICSVNYVTVTFHSNYKTIK